MKINTRSIHSTTIVKIEGDFLSETDQLALREKIRALADQKKCNVVINLAGVRYMNSCGLGSLVCALTTLRKVGGNLQLTGIGPEVQRLLKITALDTIFGIIPSVDEIALDSAT